MFAFEKILFPLEYHFHPFKWISFGGDDFHIVYICKNICRWHVLIYGKLKSNKKLLKLINSGNLKDTKSIWRNHVEENAFLCANSLSKTDIKKTIPLQSHCKEWNI